MKSLHSLQTAFLLNAPLLVQETSHNVHAPINPLSNNIKTQILLTGLQKYLMALVGRRRQ